MRQPLNAFAAVLPANKKDPLHQKNYDCDFPSTMDNFVFFWRGLVMLKFSFVNSVALIPNRNETSRIQDSSMVIKL